MAAVSLEQAIELIRLHTPAAKAEEVPLFSAAGRILREDVISAIMQPSFDRSPLDGYAVRAADICGASERNAKCLRVTSCIYAGEEAKAPVHAGEAARIMTGAMIPAGADCVIRQEDTEEKTSEEARLVYIKKEAAAGSNICRKGEEYGRGALLIKKGSRLDAAALAVAAGAGVTKLSVAKKLRAAVLITGDEVVEPGEDLLPGRIYDTNAYYIAARLGELGVEVELIGKAGDQKEELCSKIKAALQQADLVITTGGVSVGEKDLVELSLREMQAEIIFHGIKMKPGMPTLFAMYGEKMLLCLSGNPFSAAVPFELLIREILAQYTGCDAYQIQKGVAQTKNAYLKKSPTRRFLRAHADTEHGTVSVYMPKAQENGQMRSMIGCDCLIDIPAGTQQVGAGELVKVIWI